MNDDSRFTEGAMVSAEVANRAINDALQFASPIPAVCDSPAPADSSAAPSEVVAQFQQDCAKVTAALAAQPAPVSAQVSERESTCRACHPPEFPSYCATSIEGDMAPADLWDYACMVGWRCGNFPDAAPVAVAPSPAVVVPSRELTDTEILDIYKETLSLPVSSGALVHKTFSINFARAIESRLVAAALATPSPARESLSNEIRRLTDELRRAKNLHFNYVYEVSRIANHEDSICNFPETDKVREWIANLTEQVLATHRQPEDSALIAAIDESALRDGVIEGLVGLLGCGRTWSAWQAGTMTERDFYSAAESDECIDQVVDAIKSRLATKEASVQGVPDGGAPAILEALSYHAGERDDLTLEDAVKAFRFGYKEVRQRDDRAMLAQLIHLLASAPKGD